GPVRVGLSQTEDKLRGERSLTVARPGAKPGARPLSRFGACAGLAIPRQSFARWRQSGARSERPRRCREPSVGGFGILVLALASSRRRQPVTKKNRTRLRLAENCCAAMLTPEATCNLSTPARGWKVRHP